MESQPDEAARPDFDGSLRERGLSLLTRRAPRTLQVNVGKICNQACHHCHVDAGPKRSEQMEVETARRAIHLLEGSAGVETLDVTGGAPELNQNFRFLVETAGALGRRVIVRCNLTVILEPAMEWLPAFYRDNHVELVCSLPCYTADNTDRQRGSGVFHKSIEALHLLNYLGYGRAGSGLRLDLVYNPVGAILPPAQVELEARYRAELGNGFGIEFGNLLTITNMPINRFAEQLARWGMEREYMSLLVNHFNPATVENLMCRDLVSVGYTGALYDCDFNQMLEIPLRGRDGRARTIWDLDDLSTLGGRMVATGAHCFGCAAGAGSSCGGALAQAASA
ncbi:MAG TPA: arsenosugar biosynthesis radical SAM (seleno)protein ArsS [Candidatus Binataceae bacterium]